jgi:hypothetical protein
MQVLNRAVLLLLCGASTLFPAVPLGCASGVPLGDFHLDVRSDPKLPPLPLRGINRLEEGQIILYAPDKLRLNPKGGEVALVLAPAPSKPGTLMSELPKLEVLDPKPANKPARWVVPYRTGVVAVVYGPQGVSIKKVKALFAKDQDLIAQLADYAEKTAQTEALLTAINAWSPQSDGDVDAALKGFASQYGINNQVDPTLPRSQQTLLMMRSINPSLAGVDPVAQDASQLTAQSAALATSVASIFFGTPVGLAASGGALFMNLRGMMFPNTEFRSSFALIPESPNDKLDLCGKRDPAKPRMKVAYLWAARIPNASPPSIKIESADHLPLGLKAPLAVSMDDAAWKVVDRARDWKLVAEDGKTAFDAKVKSSADHKALDISLEQTNAQTNAQAKASPGRYHLQAAWDWDTLHASGEVYLHAIEDFKKAHLAEASQDQMLEHRGRTVVQVEDADFEFVEKAAVAQKDDKFNLPVSVPISLPKGKQEGMQDHLNLQIDTSSMSAGDYNLMLTQADGKTYNIPFKVLPPAPRIANLPLLINAGEKEQSVQLRGENLDRLTKLEAPGAAFKLGPITGDARELFVELKPDAHPGEQFELKEYAQNTNAPAVSPGGVKVVGPRPQILNAQISLPPGNQVVLQKNELPAGTFVNASLQVKHARAGTTVHLTCDTPGSKEVALRVGEQNSAGSAQVMSEDTLFLTFDPGAWPAACTVSAILENRGEGHSKPYVLGKVVRVPEVDTFEITDERSDANYLGKLTGAGLEVIARVGWGPDAGIPVTALPVPVGGDRRKQSLQIALPWPPPSPRAPLWVWFRGDEQGRETKIRYGAQP